MLHPDTDALAGLVLGDEVGPDVREHVDGCPDCRTKVDALARVHAAARSAEGLVPAPADVRGRVFAQVAAEPTSDLDAGPVTPASAVVQLPARTRRPRRGVPLWAAGVAAAVTLMAGLGLGRLTVDTTTVPPPDDDQGSVVASAELAPLLGRQAGGEVSAVDQDGALTLRVRARDLGDGIGYHEVWLLNVDGKRMVALGLLASGEEGDFRVPRRFLEEGYSIVDISIEPDDGDPTHSGVSLARGELA